MTETTRWGILATGGIATSFVKDLRLLPAYFLDQETHEEGVRQLHAAIADWHAERSAVA